MKVLIVFLMSFSLGVSAAKIPSKPLPVECRLYDEYAVSSHIENVRFEENYGFTPAWCLAINGICFEHYSHKCYRKTVGFEITLEDGVKKSFINEQAICRYFYPDVEPENVRCEIGSRRPISLNAYCSSSGSNGLSSISEVDIKVSTKMTGDILKTAKCNKIVTCLENGMNYFKRKNVEKWAKYYGCEL